VRPLEYLATVWQVAMLALRLDPEAVRIVEAHPHGLLVAFGVAFLGGASLLLGQSVILFLNRLRPGRFVASLLLNGTIFAIGWILTCIMLWLVARFVFNAQAGLGSTSRIVLLSTAPFVLGFLVLMPYVGSILSRVLYVWSLIIAVNAVEYAFQLSFGAALVCVTLAWILMMLLTSTVGRPIVAIRNHMWERVVGTRLDAPVAVVVPALPERSPPAGVDGERPS
jgi:Yip1 domain